MSDRTGRRLAWALMALIVIAYLAEAVLLFATADLASLDPADQTGPWLQALEDLAFVVIGLLGLRIVLRHPSNAVGWWIMAAGISFPLEGLSVELTQYGLEHWGAVPIVIASAWVSQWIWILASFNIPFLLLLYPDGHLPSPRWRPALWFAVGMLCTAFFAFAVYVDPASELPNPVGFLSLGPAVEAVVLPVFAVGQYLLLLTGFASLVSRYRNGEGLERQQVKVLVWVGAVSVVFFVVTGNLALPDWLNAVLNVVFALFVASAITLAILRYRLYDFDRLVSRTVSYTLVAGTLAVVYGFGAIWLPSRVVGEQTPLFVAGSTLAVAALFNPLRRRMMNWVDRKFNRSRYDIEQTVQEFAARLNNQTDAGQIAEDWNDVINSTLQPSAVGVWIRDVGNERQR